MTTPDTRTPTTEAGRALLDDLLAYNDLNLVDEIRAIEAEAARHPTLDWKQAAKRWRFIARSGDRQRQRQRDALYRAGVSIGVSGRVTLELAARTDTEETQP
jgi:hypothetical protein